MKKMLTGLMSAGLLLSGCMNENSVESGRTATAPEAGETGPARVWTPEENAAIKAKIVDIGFAEADIKDAGDYFLVEKDILFEKAALEGDRAPLAKAAHNRSQYIVRDDKAHVITVKVDATARKPLTDVNSTTDWLEATKQAIVEWNNLGYFTRFVYLESGTADVTVVGGYQSPMEWLVAASFPNSSGLPGSKIMGRTDWPSSVSARKLEIVHSLGHTIGLHHTHGTSTPVVGSATSVAPFAAIPSTPATDALSIMGKLPYFEDPWPGSGFSFGDSQAMRRLYSSHIKATPNNIHRYTADVDGNGRADLVTFDEDGVVVSIANPVGIVDGFRDEKLWNNQYGSRAAAGGWSNTNHVRALADVNGDGKADVVGFGQAAVYVSLSNGSSFAPLPSAAISNFCYNQGWRTDRHIRLLGDVTGDGKADIVGFSDNEVLVSAGRADGYFNAPTVWNTDFGYNDGWNLVKDYPRQLADVTGDGKADIVCFGHNAVIVGVSNGSGFASATWASGATFVYSQGWRDAQHIRTFGDVDGDGKMDIIGFSENDAIIGLSTGSSFTQLLGSSLFGRLDGYEKSQTVRLVADVTGDRRADIVAVSLNEVQVGTSQGTSFSVSTWHGDFAQNDGWRVADHLRTVADVTGDGKADFIGFGYNEGILGRSTGSNFNAELWY